VQVDGAKVTRCTRPSHVPEFRVQVGPYNTICHINDIENVTIQFKRMLDVGRCKFCGSSKIHQIRRNENGLSK
jgi:hypothetical protein